MMTFWALLHLYLFLRVIPKLWMIWYWISHSGIFKFCRRIRIKWNLFLQFNPTSSTWWSKTIFTLSKLLSIIIVFILFGDLLTTVGSCHCLLLFNISFILTTICLSATSFISNWLVTLARTQFNSRRLSIVVKYRMMEKSWSTSNSRNLLTSTYTLWSHFARSK